MKIILTKEELANAAARHDRAVAELVRPGLFSSEHSAFKYIDLLADRQRGHFILPSHRTWLDEAEQRLIYAAAKRAGFR